VEIFLELLVWRYTSIENIIVINLFWDSLLETTDASIDNVNKLKTAI
jgi:hypothetical protein